MKKFYYLPYSLNLNLLIKSSKLCLYTKTQLEYIKLPKFYFFKDSNLKKELIIINKSTFISLIKNILLNLKYFIKFHFIKLRMKGLGYRINEVTEILYSFFYNWINFIYLFIPIKLIMKVYKKRFFLLSRHLYVLNFIIIQLLELKKLGPYSMRGLRLIKFFMIKKRGGKKK